MPDRIILLCGDVEAPHLSTLLKRHRAELDVTWVNSFGSLMLAADDLAGTRLVAMMTDVIVPESILSRLETPAYNFHPGPPEYPGSHAAGFAVYDDAATFGVTLHEMAAAVDSGPIVEVRRYDMPTPKKFLNVEMLAFEKLMEMFRDHAEHLACNDAPLPHSGDQWIGPTRTKAEAKRLSAIEADLTEEEINRRYRAFG